MKKNYVFLGVVPFVSDIVKKVNVKHDKKRAIALLKMITLAQASIYCLPKRTQGTSAHLKLFDKLHVPALMLNHLRSNYFGESKMLKDGIHVFYGLVNVHRIYADMLCLILLLSEPDFHIPIEPIKNELNISEFAAVRLLKGMGCT